MVQHNNAINLVQKNGVRSVSSQTVNRLCPKAGFLVYGSCTVLYPDTSSHDSRSCIFVVKQLLQRLMAIRRFNSHQKLILGSLYDHLRQMVFEIIELVATYQTLIFYKLTS